MDIKITCALAVLNACLGNDPSQVTERMNALHDINKLGFHTSMPYAYVIKYTNMSPQEYCKYSLMPLSLAMGYHAGDKKKV